MRKPEPRSCSDSPEVSAAQTLHLSVWGTSFYYQCDWCCITSWFCFYPLQHFRIRVSKPHFVVMTTPYSLDAAIDSFFESNPTTATRRQCDDFALVHGTPVTPVQIQGTFSYTVLVGTDKIFQFRISSSSIDPDLLNLVATTHGEFVPRCKYHGTVGGTQPLSIYEMNKLSGTSYILAWDPDSVACQQRTVHDLAT